MQATSTKCSPERNTENQDQGRQTAMYFIIEEAKQTILDFSQETMRIL